MRATAESPRSPRSLVWPSLCLGAALLSALLSSFSRAEGHFYVARVLAVVGLLLGMISGLVLVPELVSRIRLDILSQLKLSRLTRRGLIFACLVLVVGFAALNTGNNLLILVFSALVAAVIVSGTVSNLVLYGIEISLELPTEIHSGQQVVLFLTLHNRKKFFPSFALRLRGAGESAGLPPDSTDLFQQEKSFPYVRAYGETRLNLICSFRRRGVYVLKGFDVTTTFPFGFFRRGRRIEAEGSILVYPALVELDAFLLQHPILRGEFESSRKGLGAGIYNIRGYQGGDPVRYVHWRSTAKVGRLMVKDFVSEEDTPFHLVFSTCLPAVEGWQMEQFEKAVSYVASLADWWHRRKMPFWFYSGDFKIEVQAGDNKQMAAVMEFLAFVSPSSVEQTPLEDLPEEVIVFRAGKAGQSSGVLSVDYLEL